VSSSDASIERHLKAWRSRVATRNSMALIVIAMAELGWCNMIFVNRSDEMTTLVASSLYSVPDVSLEDWKKALRRCLQRSCEIVEVGPRSLLPVDSHQV
jgi:hypothetical protein